MRPRIGWGNKNSFLLIISSFLRKYFQHIFVMCAGVRGRECWWIIYSGKDSMQWMRHRLNAGGKTCAFVTLRFRLSPVNYLDFVAFYHFKRLRLTFSSSLSTLHRNEADKKGKQNGKSSLHAFSLPHDFPPHSNGKKNFFFITKPKFRTEVEQTLFVLK